MKLKLILANLLVTSHSQEFKNKQYSDKKLYRHMISEEVIKDFKDINLDIFKIIEYKDNDDKIYKKIVSNLMPNRIPLLYIPGISFLLSFLIIGIFTLKTKGHESVKDNADNTKIFKFYFSQFPILANVIKIIFNIGLYFLIQNYRFDLNYMIGICLFIPILTTITMKILQLIYGKYELEKQQRKDIKEIFKSEPFFITNTDEIPNLFFNYYIFEGGKMWLMQIVYIIYFAYNIKKTNALHDKAREIKNNKQITDSMMYLKQNDLTKEDLNIIAKEKQNSSNYSYDNSTIV